MFGENSIVPIVVQNLGIALITAFIPVGIFIFSDKKRLILDKHIIINSVIKGNVVILGIVLIYFPYLFWNVEFLRFYYPFGYIYFDSDKLLFLISLVGILVVFCRVCISYKWIIEDNKHKKRLRFLIQNLPEMVLIDSWKSVWAQKEFDAKRQLDFFMCFSKSIDNKIDMNAISFGKMWSIFKKDKNAINDLKQTYNLLDCFYKSLNNLRLSELILFDGFLPVILRWHEHTWHEEKLRREKKLYDQGRLFSGIRTILNRIINSIFLYSLHNDLSYHTFSNLNQHIQNHIDNHHEQSTNAKCLPYFKTFEIYNKFFETIPSLNNITEIFSQYFPESWKITQENFYSQPMAICWLNHYLLYVNSTIITNRTQELAVKLDLISTKLFPSVELDRWATILSFVNYSWTQSRVQSYILKGKSFGIYKPPDYSKENIDMNFTNMLSMQALAEQNVDTRKLDIFIGELESLKNNYVGEKSELNRTDLLTTFKAIRKYIADNH